MSKPTLKDIAREAGISVMAVSAVLNGSGRSRVSSATRQSVLSIAKRVGYHKNLAASSTRTGKVDSIAVFARYSSYRDSEPVSRINRGIQTAASSYGFSIRLFDADTLDLSIQRACEHRIQRAIFVGSELSARLFFKKLCDKNHIKAVFVYENPVDGSPAVNADNYAAGYLAAQTLLASGRRRLGLICGDHERSVHIEGKHAGFVAGLREFGISLDQRWAFCQEDWRLSMDKLLSMPAAELPDGLFLLSDNYAMHLIGLAARKAIRIPEDISCISCGNFHFIEDCLPALTSIDMALSEVGSTAVHLLLDKPIEIAEKGKGLYLVAPRLVVRDSIVPLAEICKSAR